MKLLLLALFVAPSLAIIEYNETEARLLLEASAAAYSKNPLTCLNKAFPSGHGFEVKNAGQDIPCDSAGNTCSYYVAVSIPRKEILIAFRGTVGTAQFNKEVEASLQPKEEFKKYGKVNKYFWDAFNLLWPRLSTTLNEKSTEDYKIVFTGYSLGGALASLAAMKTYADLIRPTELIKLVTFGEPRVGNPTYATNFDRAVQYSYRVVHKADQVPHMPPCKDGADKLSCEHTALDRSYHHGKEVWYNNDMNPGDSYLVLTDSDEDVKGSNSITPKYELKDHLTYFGRVVGDYGTADCNEAAVAKPKSAPVTSLASFLVLLVLYVLA